MNKILKLALVLLAVSAIVAGVLGIINELTYPVIDAQKQAKTAEAFASVLKADRFDEVEFDNPDFPTVLTVHKAEGVGYVVTSKFSGAQGNITLAVGVDNDYTPSPSAWTTTTSAPASPSSSIPRPPASAPTPPAPARSA